MVDGIEVEALQREPEVGIDLASEAASQEGSLLIKERQGGTGPRSSAGPVSIGGM